MRKAEAREALTVARAERIAAEGAYKRTWKAHPTAKGFPLVDKALSRVHEAEASETAAERALAEAY